MSKFLENSLTSIRDSISSGVEKNSGVFTSKAEKEAQSLKDETEKLLKSFQVELENIEKRSWVDNFSENFHKLIQPIIVIFVLSFIGIAFFSPSHSSAMAGSINLIPEGYWAILGVVMAFYFGSQIKIQNSKFEARARVIQALIEAKKEFRELALDKDEPDRIFGSALANDPKINTLRSNQSNDVVECALNHSIRNGYCSVSLSENTNALREKIALMESETETDLISRCHSGSKRFTWR
ncbi:3TM-type holin [Alteromonas oceani]|uniref:3TM-type holin n=1 Tax=Alteromonas oceani TaxID=2071609 RepID=A0ABV7JVX1_9ALTE|nr:3TM-type holin [Alteromonas oceani]